MPVMLERWNDDRMDALATRVDGLDGRMEKGFARVDAELGDLHREMRAGFARVDKRFERLEERWDERFERMEERWDDRFERMEERWDDRFERLGERLDKRFDGLHRLLFQASVVTITALIGLLAAARF
jgi:hypothetical protein